MKLRRGVLAAVLLALTACAPQGPVKLGFPGGLSGRVADLGEAGRNGVLLAVGEANAAGGVKGRQIEMLIRVGHAHGLTQPLTTSTWAATESLIQLGGRLVEGVTLAQFFNREDQSPRYRAFAAAYLARFKAEPGFASVAAHDATIALLAALSRSGKGQSLKQALLAGEPFDGLQERWNFDRNGEARHQTYITTVRDGRFVRVE